MRPRVLAALLAGAMWGHDAWAGPPTMVHTKDGSVYYGDLVERVVGDHVTLILATSVIKKFPWKDIDESPVVLPAQASEPPEPAPHEVVRTKNGSMYYGEVIEKIIGSHITLKLETGELKTFDDEDIDVTPPRRTSFNIPLEPAPVVNERTLNGSIYHGQVIERVVGDHVTLKLETGAIKTLAWEDLEESRRPPPPRPPPVRPAVELTFASNDPRAVLQQHVLDGSDDGFGDVCTAPCEKRLRPDAVYRVVVPGEVTMAGFRLPSSHEDHVVATLHPRGRLIAGVVTAIVALPVQIVGIGLAYAASSAPTYSVTRYGFAPVDNSGLGIAAVTLNAVAPAILAVGIALFLSSMSTVHVNDRRVARVLNEGLRF